MSEVRRLYGDLFLESLLYEPGPDLPTMEIPVMTDPPEEHFHALEEDFDPLEDFDIMTCIEGRDQVALRLACIGDEMDLRLRSPRLAQLPGMAMNSLALALTYNQTGVRGVLGSLVDSLSDLRENIRRFWRSQTPRTWVLLPGLLLLLLLLLLLPQ
ncbi:PREDICTED: bcl-2-interacting killer [Galeopterus variegatus]|uniref:Bcl-2-interacting killer n=1 Tax=Galeopterus variegatus TaxID=482537 RepID=A0ABM0R811_GALVR|nr:PREDICTED: bcl-2-interacting killer [Galeopterus variegatus]